MSSSVFNLSQVEADITDKMTKIYLTSEDPNLGFFEGSKFFAFNPYIENIPTFIRKGVFDKIHKVETNPIHKTINNSIKVIPMFSYTLISSSAVNFGKHNELVDYSYSLGKIYRFQKPIVQFRRAHTYLDSYDTETLFNEWIYVSRTVFGRLLNSLPRTNKLDFIGKVFNTFSTENLKEISYLEGLRFLKDYIDEFIITKGKYLVDIDHNIRTKLKNVIKQTDDIGFVLKEGYVESIRSQSKLFSHVFELENVLQKVEEGLRETENSFRDSKNHFETIFKNTSWPIDLNKDE